jgi:hypothetical protein
VAVSPRFAPNFAQLLRNREYVRLLCAVLVHELGDAFHYIALMWFALESGGPLGAIAVRLAGTLPSLLFGFIGGASADRHDARRTMIRADIVRGMTLLPLGVWAISATVPLWALVFSAVILEVASNYFGPAYGRALPSLVGREQVLQANAIMRAGANTVRVTGWGASAMLVSMIHIETFFLLNAAAFFASAAFIRGLPAVVAPSQKGVSASGYVDVVGNIRTNRSLGAALPGRLMVHSKSRASSVAWLLVAPGYGLFAMADEILVLCAGSLLVGLGQAMSRIFINTAIQEEVPRDILGKTLGLLSIADRGGHGIGFLLIAPLSTLIDVRVVFTACALSVATLVWLGVLAGRVRTRIAGDLEVNS